MSTKINLQPKAAQNLRLWETVNLLFQAWRIWALTSDEYRLHLDIMDKNWTQFRNAAVDLFATGQNTQCAVVFADARGPSSHRSGLTQSCVITKRMAIHHLSTPSHPPLLMRVWQERLLVILVVLDYTVLSRLRTQLSSRVTLAQFWGSLSRTNVTTRAMCHDTLRFCS